MNFRNVNSLGNQIEIVNNDDEEVNRRSVRVGALPISPENQQNHIISPNQNRRPNQSLRQNQNPHAAIDNNLLSLRNEPESHQSLSSSHVDSVAQRNNGLNGGAAAILNQQELPEGRNGANADDLRHEICIPNFRNRSG